MGVGLRALDSPGAVASGAAPQRAFRVPRDGADGEDHEAAGSRARPASRFVVAVGPLPPPVHGMSAVTQQVVSRFARVVRVAVADTSGGSLLRSRNYHWTRLCRNLGAATKVLVNSARPGRLCYLACDNGYGMIYSTAIALVARLCRYRLIIHHHSYAYAERQAWGARMLTAAAGRGAVHIVFSDDMQRRLSSLYPAARRFHRLSNAAFIERPRMAEKEAGRSLRLGHLSNLSPQKGLPTVLSVFKALSAEGLPCELSLAGPATAEAAALIAEAAADFGPALRYVGPVTAAQKALFFAGLDVFLFPTTWTHEAEPLVVLEALAHGVPVVAFRRGVIGNLLEHSGGIAIDPTEDFLSHAIPYLRGIAGDQGRLRQISMASARRFVELQEGALSQFEAMLDGV